MCVGACLYEHICLSALTGFGARFRVVAMAERPICVLGSIGDKEKDFAECLGASDDAPGCLHPTCCAVKLQHGNIRRCRV